MSEVTPGVEPVVDERSMIGEGPFWDERRGVLHWVDIMRNLLHTYDPSSGTDTALNVGQPVGAASLRANGGFVLALRDGYAVLDEEGTVEMIAPVEADNPRTRMNDGNCDRAGRFWAGTMSVTEEANAGALYCLEADRSARRVVDAVTVSNGIGWSPDDRIMYYIDSPTQGLDSFPYDIETGALGPRRRVATIPTELGVPDGHAVDADGCIWVAVWGGWVVQRYTPDGKLDRVVRLPVSQVSSCAFGGPNLDELYITSAGLGLDAEALAREPLAGSLFHFLPGVQGMPRQAYRG